METCPDCRWPQTCKQGAPMCDRLKPAKDEVEARRSAAACSPRVLARKIAERLLVNAFGDIGTRLDIRRETNLQKETSLGGWCLEAAVDQIAKVIEENADVELPRERKANDK